MCRVIERPLRCPVHPLLYIFVCFVFEYKVGPYRQSERGAIYKEMADKLVASGWAYPCFSTEQELIAKREEVIVIGNAPLPV